MKQIVFSELGSGFEYQVIGVSANHYTLELERMAKP
jgi:hypothetical protein